MLPRQYVSYNNKAVARNVTLYILTIATVEHNVL